MTALSGGRVSPAERDVTLLQLVLFRRKIFQLRLFPEKQKSRTGNFGPKFRFEKSHLRNLSLLKKDQKLHLPFCLPIHLQLPS